MINPLTDAQMDRGFQLLRGSHDILPCDPVEIGHERQLVMDRWVVDDVYDCRRTVHEPVKHPDNPIISAEHQYESLGPNSWGSVLREPASGKFRMWTPVFDAELREQAPNGAMVKRGHYYESDDGLTWARPELGLVEYKGSTANNIFLGGDMIVDNVFVFPLPDRWSEPGRYGMVYCHNLIGEHQAGSHNMHNHIAISEDGLHWEDLPGNPIWKGRTDTNNCIVYNAARDVFMMYRRSTINAKEIRRIAYAESKDLISWTQPRTIIFPDELDKWMLYAMPVTEYHGIYLGFLMTLYLHPDWDVRRMDKEYQMDTQLAWSRDGIGWERHPQRPIFIDTGSMNHKSCDWGQARGMANIIEKGEDVYIYYGGIERLHTPGFHGADQRSHICLATLKRDRFVSIDAGEREGFILTKPFRHPGGRLHINAKTATGGMVCAAIREGAGVRDGEWPEQWRFDRSIPFTGDSLNATMQWKDAADVASMEGQVIRLHLGMIKTELYSFWFE